MIQFLFPRRTAVVPVLAALLAAPGLAAHAQPFSVPSHRIDGTLVYDGIPPVDTTLASQVARYEQWRQATFLDWLADGSLLIATRFGADSQVHRLASPLGMREQLTFGDGSVIEARAPRTGAGFVFVRQTNGYPQLFDYPGAGAARQITRGNYLHGSPVWSHDGKRVTFYGTDRTGVNDDIYVVNISTAARPQLVVAASAGSWRPLAWSQDDSKLLLLNTLSPQKSALYVADAATGALTPLALPESRITGADFAPDGVGYYLISDAQSNFEQLLYYNPITHITRRVSADVPWDVETFAVGAGGHYVAYAVNDDGQSRLTVLDTLRNLEFKPPGLQDGRIGDLRFDDTGQKLAFSYESARSPRDVYVYDAAQGALRRWTRSEIGPLDRRGLATAQLVHYPTWDRLGLNRRTLSAYVYLPRGPSPCPVLIALPGGQELHSQSRPDWQPFIQFVVNDLGYAVIAPNVRGSSGYGKAFRALDGGKLRDDAVRDVGALLVWIGLQPGLDSHHVAVIGHGYGGFLALASLATYGDHLQGAIDVAGIANLVDFVGHSPAAERAQRVAEFGDVQDTEMRAFLDRISPLDNVALIHRPVLIVQGLDAPGSRAADAQQLVWRLRSERNQVWYLSASDAGNDFTTPVDRRAYLDTAAQFLEFIRRGTSR
ncbi:MAG TPA: prolyl oligopeptidase family serine peptidase [Steroidobacteraceae bacterium]|nr:prolyl oligopeptidase family serine peptidase [Steroidobacteraceae bacterium]